MEVTYVFCPPCSGSGEHRERRGSETTNLGPNGTSLVRIRDCELCGGRGEAPEEIVEAFWGCVLKSLDGMSYKIPWGCAVEVWG